MKLLLSASCGPIRHPSTEAWRWIHIDHESSHNPDICCDVTSQLTDHFPVGSVDAVENTHGLEHYNFHTGTMGFLNQAFQVLKPGGIMRISVPDLQLIATAYVNGSNLHEIYGKDFAMGWRYIDCPAERFFAWCRLWDHQVFFDFALLSRMVADAGFTQIRKAGFNDSAIPGWRWDRYESESLYLEAVRL